MDAFLEANFFDLANEPTLLGNAPNHSSIARGSLNRVLSTTAASLSLAGTLAIFASFWMWPDLRTNSRRMIVFMSVGDFSVAAVNIVGLWGINSGTGVGCQIQAAFGVVAVLPSLFWTIYLSLYFYLIICRRISMEWEKRVLRLFHVTAWGIPPTIAVIAFALKGVGYSGSVSSSGWCWISNNQAWWKMVLWMCITGKAWEIIAYITIPIFYILVKTHIRRQIPCFRARLVREPGSSIRTSDYNHWCFRAQFGDLFINHIKIWERFCCSRKYPFSPAHY